MSRFSLRHFSVLLVPFFVFALLLAEQNCFAQDDEGEEQQAEQQVQAPPAVTPETRLKQISDNLFNNGGWWGPGGYFSPIKLPLYILIFLVWVGSASWVNADQERLRRENRENFNLFYLLLYGIGGTMVFFIPIFWAALPLTLLICLVPALTYVVIRNGPLPPGDKVLTGEHLWYLFAVNMNKIGCNIKYGPRTSYEGGPPVELEAIAKGVDAQQILAWKVLARNAPGFNLLRESIYDAIQSRATAIRFDFTPEQTKIWHQVDGAWLELVPVPAKLGRSREMEIYEEMQESVKKLIGANHEDRRSKQWGKIRAVVAPVKKKAKPTNYDLDYVTQGTPTGEAAMFQFQSKVVPFKTLEDIGAKDEMKTKILEQINAEKGFVLVAAPPAHGLRSTMTVLSRASDRFTKDIANVEDVNGASEAIENVMRGLYDPSKGETPAAPLADLLFKGIATIFVRDMSAPETLKIATDTLADDDRLIITMLRAKDGVETLKRFLAVGVPPPQVVPHLRSVIGQRLIRRLCAECKEPYEPEPKVLQQLRLHPNQVQQLYRKRTPLPLPHEEAKRGICHKCHGVGYFGRTALFEVLIVSDAVKALLLANAEPAAIRQQFNKEGQQTFLHSGIRLLVNGETSVDELSRILKI